MKDSEFIELLNLYLDHEISAADAVRIEAEVMTGDAGVADGVFGENAAGPAADEFADPCEGIGPKLGFERRIVDFLDQIDHRGGSSLPDRSEDAVLVLMAWLYDNQCGLAEARGRGA